MQYRLRIMYAAVFTDFRESESTSHEFTQCVKYDVLRKMQNKSVMTLMDEAVRLAQSASSHETRIIQQSISTWQMD